MAKREPASLLNEPPKQQTNARPDAPVSVVVNHLMHETGNALELTTRMNQAAARAAQVSYIYASQMKDPITHEIGSEFIVNMNEKIQRLLVSYGGEGRKDLIAALQAGGRLPDSYYETGKKPNYLDVSD